MGKEQGTCSMVWNVLTDVNLWMSCSLLDPKKNVGNVISSVDTE